jgi:broad specificity phosphatase PhoE
MPLSVAPGLTLYFCRHGETEANVARRFQGRTLDTPLTPKGIEQARRIGGILRHQCDRPSGLRYVASPLPRAQHTIRIIRKTVGLPIEGFAVDGRLLEINLGSWDGLTDAEARALDPEVYARRTANKGPVRVPGGGENYEDVAKRAESWVADIAVDTFAVSHGAFTRILRGLFDGMTWQQMSDLDEKQGVLFRVRGSAVERLES